MCHILFVLPLISLPVFFLLPFYQAVVAYALVLLVSGAFYWLIWKDMQRPVTTGIEGMIGAVGQVVQRGERAHKVLVKGGIWDATCEEHVAVGESVEIIGLDRMQLSVRKRPRHRHQASSRESSCR